MKNSFILQGKKFISAKRAAKVSEYSSDYIGQLCRSNKLECRKIGHVWFVSEISLYSHLAKIAGDSSLAEQMKNLRDAGKGSAQALNTFGITSSSNSSNSSANVVSVNSISTKTASNISGYSTDYIGQLCRSGKVSAKLIGNSWLIDKESLIFHMRSVVSGAPRKVEKVMAGGSERESYKSSKIARKSLFSYTLNIAGLIIVAIVILGAFSITFIPADKSSELASSFSDYVAGLFKDVPRNGNSVIDENSNVGIVISPSTGVVEKDEIIKSAVKSAFSDDVVVNSDQDATTGVIKPIFKNSKGKDFVYVMVPVNAATSSQNRLNGGSP